MDPKNESNPANGLGAFALIPRDEFVVAWPTPLGFPTVELNFQVA
jgi:hypothetical protein